MTKSQILESVPDVNLLYSETNLDHRLTFGRFRGFGTLFKDYKDYSAMKFKDAVLGYILHKETRVDFPPQRQPARQQYNLIICESHTV